MPLDETSHYICLGMLSSLLLGRCTFDGTPINGRTLNRFLIKGATLQHNSIVEYSCDSSYKLTGSKVLRCKDGRWNATTPSCKGIIIYAQHKKQENVTFRILESGINLSVWPYISFPFFIYFPVILLF